MKDQKQNRPSSSKPEQEEKLTPEEIVDRVKEALAKHDQSALRYEFFKNHPYDQAKIYIKLSDEERRLLYQYISAKELADVYDVLDEDEQEDIIDYLEAMDDQYAANMLGEMYRDNAADILKKFSPNKIVHYMRLIPIEQAEKIKTLMDYEDETAGAIMTTEFVQIKANQTIKSAMTLVRAKAENAETIYYLYVVDDDSRLVGVLTLRDLITSDANRLVSEAMSPRVVTVSVDDNQQDVARTIQDYDFLAIPVIEATGELLGIITVDDILDVMDEEAVADYSGLAGVSVDEPYQTPVKSAQSRLPWLITLLFLGMGTSTLIGHFEDMISEVATLSLFITLITGTSGNAGTQSLAVAVRKIANPDNEESTFLQLIFRELFTGLICGLITGGTIFLIITLWQKNMVLGLVVGVAMLCAITVANLAGSIIPLLMDRLGFDPAVASGPFITTLSDLTSVLIYFSIASQFLLYLS